MIRNVLRALAVLAVAANPLAAQQRGTPADTIRQPPKPRVSTDQNEIGVPRVDNIPLDPELRGEVLRVLRQMDDEGMTMIVVTHEMAFARAVADRVLFFDGGLITEDGPPAQVFDFPRHERTREFLRKFADPSP